MRMFYLDPIILSATGYEPTENDLVDCIAKTNEVYTVEDVFEFVVVCNNKPFNDLVKGIIWKERMAC